MNFRKVFRRTFGIITNPTNTWQALSRGKMNTMKEDFRYFYILLALDVFVAFLGGLFYQGEKSLVSVVMNAIIVGVDFYAGFWIIYYLSIGWLNKKYHFVTQKSKVIRLIIYSLSLSMILSLFMSLLPELYFLRIIVVYTLYIVWEAVGRIIYVNETERSNFVLILSLIIVMTPVIINFLLHKIIPVASL